MADSTFATKISKDESDNSLSNYIYVNLSDGTHELDINADGSIPITGTFTANAEKAEDAAHGSGDTGNYVLAVRQDTLASSTSADGDYASFKVNASGALYVSVSNSTIAVTQSGTWDIGTLTSITNDVNIADGGNSITVDDGGTSLTVDGTVSISGDVNVTNSGTFAVQVDNIAYAEDAAHSTGSDGAFVLGVRNTALADVTSTDGDYSQISTTVKGAVLTELLQGGAALSSSNGLPVTIVDSTGSGTEVHDDDSTVVAASSTGNHDYTVTGTTFYLHQVTCGSSGAFSCEVLTGPLATLVSKRKGFVGDRNGGYLEFTFKVPVEVPVTSTGTVRVVRGNRNPSSALSMYSSIEGYDI